jgi:Spy/CpxP family protein refolding chaperone
MRNFRMWALAVTAVTLWVTPARPEDKDEKKWVPEEGAVQIMLLRQQSVRDDLKLTADEAKKIQDFTLQQWEKARSFEGLSPAERRQKFAELSKENERFLDEVLEPAERQRLNQITLQVAGLLWVTRPEVASELKLTRDQKAKALWFQRKARREMQDLIYSNTREDKNESLRELRKTCRHRLMDVLTDEQEEKWQKMAGAPFHGRLHFELDEQEGQDSTERSRPDQSIPPPER